MTKYESKPYLSLPLLIMLLFLHSLHAETKMNKEGKSVAFSINKNRSLTVNDSAPLMIFEEKGESPVEIRDAKIEYEDNGNLIRIQAGASKDLKVQQHIRKSSMAGETVYSISMDINANRDMDFVLTLPFSLATSSEDKPVFLSPGFLYRTNNAELSEGLFPQLVPEGPAGKPESSVYYFRTDRSSHCSVMATFGGKVAALCIPEGQNLEKGFYYNGHGIDSSDAENNRICITIGYKNYPARYNGNCNPRICDRWTEGPDYGYVHLEKGKTLKLQYLLFLGETPDKTSGISAFEKPLRTFYYFLRSETTRRASPDKVAKLIAEAIVNDAVVEECGLFRVIDKSDECDIGWTGGMMVAYPLLMYGKKYDHETSYETALKAMDSLTSGGFNDKANMFYDAWRDGKWTVDGWWRAWAGGYHLAYTNGQASYFLLKGYEKLTPEEKADRSLWLKRVRKVMDQAIKMQKETGEFPASYSKEDGSPGEIKGFGGCWFLPASLMVYSTFGDQKYLNAAIKAEKFYFDWMNTLEVWGTPIDAEGAVELEGNLPLIIGEKLLCEITGEDIYLKRLEHAIQYDLTWKWAYNTYLANDPLGSMNWKSQGGNGASTCNVHLHPMSNMTLDCLWYLYEKTGDDYYRQRYEDSFNFALGCINLEDGDFGFGKAGWGTEQFLHTDAIQGQGPPDGGIWTRYLPWATAAVLHGIVSGKE